MRMPSMVSSPQSKKRKYDNRRWWEELDADILKSIFSLLPYEELFLNVSLVCPSWKAACFDLAFWSRTILDLTAATAGFGAFSPLDKLYSTIPFKSGFLREIFTPYTTKFDSPAKYTQLSTTLSTLLWRIMSGADAYGQPLQRWRMSVRTLVIPYDLPISDMHLCYVAETLPGLECLSLLGSRRITVEGFERAVKNWKHLKVVHIGPDSFCDDVATFSVYDSFVQVLGRNCGGLEELQIYRPGFILNRSRCQLIAENLPGLKKLVVEMPYVFKEGVLLLHQMSHLELVQFFMGKFLMDEFDCEEGWVEQEHTEFARNNLSFGRNNDGGWMIKFRCYGYVTPDMQKLVQLYGLTPEFDGRCSKLAL